jgi:hypothetical protein
MVLLGPGVPAATTAKSRNATTCCVVVRYLHGSAGSSNEARMHPKQIRSAGEGLERSCQGEIAGRIVSTGPVGGVELLRAWFAGEAYQNHRHHTYAVGLTDSGVQVFDYRGSVHVSVPGQVAVLYPDEIHNGRAGSDDGFGYRIIYVEPALLAEAVRILRGRAYPLPFVREPVSTNSTLSHAIEGRAMRILGTPGRSSGNFPHALLGSRRRGNRGHPVFDGIRGVTQNAVQGKSRKHQEQNDAQDD